MDKSTLITLTSFCRFHGVEDSFIFSLKEIGLIEVYEIEEETYLEQEYLADFERMVRLYKEFELSPEGIDVVLSLIRKVEELQQENLKLTKKLNRL